MAGNFGLGRDSLGCVSRRPLTRRSRTLCMHLPSCGGAHGLSPVGIGRRWSGRPRLTELERNTDKRCRRNIDAVRRLGGRKARVPTKNPPARTLSRSEYGSGTRVVSMQMFSASRNVTQMLPRGCLCSASSPDLGITIRLSTRAAERDLLGVMKRLAGHLTAPTKVTL